LPKPCESGPGVLATGGIVPRPQSGPASSTDREPTTCTWSSGGGTPGPAPTRPPARRGSRGTRRATGWHAGSECRPARPDLGVTALGVVAQGNRHVDDRVAGHRCFPASQRLRPSRGLEPTRWVTCDSWCGVRCTILQSNRETRIHRVSPASCWETRTRVTSSWSPFDERSTPIQLRKRHDRMARCGGQCADISIGFARPCALRSRGSSSPRRTRFILDRGLHTLRRTFT
jgi:hypothetical protein